MYLEETILMNRIKAIFTNDENLNSSFSIAGVIYELGIEESDANYDSINLIASKLVIDKYLTAYTRKQNKTIWYMLNKQLNKDN